MRYFEIIGGFRVPISGEEAELLDRVIQVNRLSTADLKPHEKEISRRMAIRGVLRYADEETQKHVVPNNDPTLARF